MLHNPNWDTPSLTGFKKWLETQDPKQEFEYSDVCNCAVGQYLRSRNTDWFKMSPISNELNTYAHAAYESAIRENREPILGDVLAAINRELEPAGNV